MLQRLGLVTWLVILGVSQSALAQTIGDYKVYLPLISRNFAPYSEWTQDGHDAQRTGYSPIEPKEPWTLLWTWNGSNSSGSSSCTGGNPTTGHCYATGREARTVTGSGAIYVPAGSFGLYALRKDGSNSTRVLWNVRPSGVSFNGTPAYTGDYVFAGGTDGNLYRVTVSNGSYTTYNAGSPINRSILATSNHVFAITEGGVLHKVDPNTMTQVWTYNANSSNIEGTGLAYSLSRDIIIFGTNDLNVHAVNNSNGSQKWRTKPADPSLAAGFPNQFLYYWPVVAEQSGVAFVRMRLNHDAGLWGYPSSGGIWPNSNSQARTFLDTTDGRTKQNLFALNLDNGTKKFIPAVGYGGTEDLVNTTPYITTGPLPVIKVWPTGQEVAYIHFRNGQSSPPDGRWDSHMGEMVLNNSTVSGLVAGDMRFIKMARYKSGGNSQVHLSDEQNALTMAGTTIFHAHWGASESVYITDRSSTRGLSFGNPIQTTGRPPVVRRATNCGSVNFTTHYVTCGLTLFGDTRYWDGPAFWTYWNTWDPPTPTTAGQAYSDGMRPRYTYVSGDIMVVQGNGGELMVFKHSGP